MSAATTERRIGVLLVNLGTPEATDYWSMRRYLKEFLSDPRVIEENRFKWWLILNLIVLTVRPARKGRDYDKIWDRTRNESPLKTITRSQAEKLGARLKARDERLIVDWAMRYGTPAIGARLEALCAQGCDRVLLFPLYPQYAAATVATVCDRAFAALARMRFQPALRVVPPYYEDPLYIEAVARSVEAELRRLSFVPEVVLASFHGIPRAYAEKGDPYERHCLRTTELLRERLKLDSNRLIMAFQSRFGRAEWLKPYTDETVERLAREGVKRLAVVMPGFAADCLETLEEIAVENAGIFRTHGGTDFAAIPCLNDSEEGMHLLEHLALRELKGWI
jgi:ferrochelatase